MHRVSGSNPALVVRGLISYPHSYRNSIPSSAFLSRNSCVPTVAVQREFCSSTSRKYASARNTVASREDEYQKSRLAASDRPIDDETQHSRQRARGALSSASSVTDAVVTTVIGLSMGKQLFHFRHSLYKGVWIIHSS